MRSGAEAMVEESEAGVDFLKDADGFDLRARLFDDEGSHVGVEDVEAEEHDGDEDGEDSIPGRDDGFQGVDQAKEPVVGFAHGVMEVRLTRYEVQLEMEGYFPLGVIGCGGWGR